MVEVRCNVAESILEHTKRRKQVGVADCHCLMSNQYYLEKSAVVASKGSAATSACSYLHK
jgi:hypothetical protein